MPPTVNRRPPAPRAPAPNATRRTLAIYAGLSAVMAILVLIGIVVLAGDFGPFIVVAYAAIGAGLLHLWARRRLAGSTFTDEDRVLQTVAGGLLIMAVGFALVSALVDTVA